MALVRKWHHDLYVIIYSVSLKWFWFIYNSFAYLYKFIAIVVQICFIQCLFVASIHSIHDNGYIRHIQLKNDWTTKSNEIIQISNWLKICIHNNTVRLWLLLYHHQHLSTTAYTVCVTNANRASTCGQTSQLIELSLLIYGVALEKMECDGVGLPTNAIQKWKIQ